MAIITLAGGCFWCTESIFLHLKGIEKVTPGYSGGNIINPTYWDVTSGRSGHAESVQIVFNEDEIDLRQILEVFFRLHDPTQKNGQGVDIGSQYRSAIFFNTESQKQIAEETLAEAQENYSKPIVTEVTKFSSFYPADETHKDFYAKNKGGVYCRLVIDPKIQILRKEYKPFLKKTL